MLKEQTALIERHYLREFFESNKESIGKKKKNPLNVKDILKRNLIYEQVKKFLPEVDNYYGTYTYHIYLLK